MSATMLRSLLMLLSATVATARQLHPSALPLSSAIRHLRGGVAAEEDLTTILDESFEEEAADEGGAVEEPEAATTEPPRKCVLTRDEIVAKLNHIPAFAIMNEDGHMVGLQDKDEDKFACCWFTDPDEAKALLEATSAANPDKGLRLQVAGLGGAFAACNGWPDGPGAEIGAGEQLAGKTVELRLQGTHALVAELKPKLTKLLEEQGFDPGCWQLPIFMCNELQSRRICPIFIHPADLAAVWKKAGRPEEQLPENLTVMDLRMLVKSMETDENHWDLVEFIGSTKSRELALEVQQAHGPEGMGA